MHVARSVFCSGKIIQQAEIKQQWLNGSLGSSFFFFFLHTTELKVENISVISPSVQSEDNSECSAPPHASHTAIGVCE